VTIKATLYGAGNADLGLCSMGQRLLIRNDLEGVDHIPAAALGIVSELSDRVPGRQTLDTPCRLANFESPLEKRRGFLWQGKRTNGTVAGLDHGSRDPRVGLFAMRVEIHYPYPLN
jgi:hypothetical protein